MTLKKINPDTLLQYLLANPNASVKSIQKDVFPGFTTRAINDGLRLLESLSLIKQRVLTTGNRNNSRTRQYICSDKGKQVLAVGGFEQWKLQKPDYAAGQAGCIVYKVDLGKVDVRGDLSQWRVS